MHLSIGQMDSMRLMDICSLCFLALLNLILRLLYDIFRQFRCYRIWSNDVSWARFVNVQAPLLHNRMPVKQWRPLANV